jgi:hypothetical protein
LTALIQFVCPCQFHPPSLMEFPGHTASRYPSDIGQVDVRY